MNDRKYLTMKEIQQEELRLLNVLADICDKHGLTLYLDDGTLIGALRHKGFIPWDDDIDVCLPRPDFDVLMSLNDEFREHDAFLEGFYGIPLQLSAQNRLVSTRVKIKHTNVLEHGNNNLWIDILSVDGNPDNLQGNMSIYKKINFYRKSLTVGFMKKEAISNKPLAFIVTIFRPFLKSRFYRLHCAKQLNKIQRKIPYGSTQVVGSLCNVSHGEDRMPYEDFKKPIPVEFEGRTFNAMSCYDEHLRNWYGDYMTPVPEDQRTPIHRFTAWWSDPSTT